MKQSPEAEMESIAQAASGLQFLLEHNRDNKNAIKAIVEELAKQKNSPLANAVGNALQAELSKHGLI